MKSAAKTVSTIKRPAKQQLGRPKDAFKREGIVRAATVLFLKEGFELTSMDAIAKKADVSKLTIYSHFADKVALFREVVSQRCARMATPESFLALAQMPVEAALTKIGLDVGTMVFSPDSIHLQRILHGEALRQPQIVKIFYDSGPNQLRAAFAELLKDFNRQGQLDVPDTVRATQQFFSVLKGERLIKTLLLIESAPTQNEINKHVRATVDLFLAAYRPRKS